MLLCCWPARGADGAARDPEVVDKEGLLVGICESNNAGESDCDVWLEVRGDHAYVMPSVGWKPVCVAPQRRTIWQPTALTENAAQAYHPLFQKVVPDNPHDLSANVPHDLPADVLQAWISADTPLADDTVETITFCGYAIESAFLLDWSAITARLRFDLVTMRQAEYLPPGTVASRGVFESGLTISRSVIENDLIIQDASFGSYLELQENRIKSSISIKNSRFAGAARFRNNFFHGRLRIEGVEIAGDTLISGNSFPSIVEEKQAVDSVGDSVKDVEPETEFDGSSRSVVRLRETRFGGVLNINENVLRATTDTPQRSLYIQKSIISDNDLTIYDNSFTGQVFITEVEANRLTVSSNKLDGFLSVSASQFYSARTFQNQINGPFQISNNDVRSMLYMDRDVLVDGTGFLEVRANQVGREISFAPASWPRPGISVDLSFNTINGSFSVFWPVKNKHTGRMLQCSDFVSDAGQWPASFEFERWKGELALVGSAVRGSLWLAESCASSVAPMRPLIDEMAIGSDESRLGRRTGSDVSGRLAMKASGFPAVRCSASNYSFLDFKEVEAGFLRLSLPPDPYCWRGKGLQFGYFGPPIQGTREKLESTNGSQGPIVGGPEQRQIEDLYDWLERLEVKDPEVYFAAADYLRDRGYLDKSREWVEEGRRVEFGTEKCGDNIECILASLRHVFFFPSGYNTSPERAALFIVCLWFSMALVYWLYHRGCVWLLPSRSEGLVSGHSPDEVATTAFKLRKPIDYDTKVEGFVAHEPEYAYRSFSLLGYSLDVTLPLVSLGLYRTFTPTSGVVRGVSLVHHIVGFWFVTAFLSASFF